MFKVVGSRDGNPVGFDIGKLLEGSYVGIFVLKATVGNEDDGA